MAKRTSRKSPVQKPSKADIDAAKALVANETFDLAIAAMKANTEAIDRIAHALEALLAYEVAKESAR